MLAALRIGESRLLRSLTCFVHSSSRAELYRTFVSVFVSQRSVLNKRVDLLDTLQLSHQSLESLAPSIL